MQNLLREKELLGLIELLAQCKLISATRLCNALDPLISKCMQYYGEEIILRYTFNVICMGLSYNSNMFYGSCNVRIPILASN